MQSFHSEDRQVQLEAELPVLVQRLTHEEFDLQAPWVEDHSDKVTVDDIAEALNLPVSKVIRQLEEIRRQQQEARLSEQLRKLEEPLYRVERPCTSSTPKTDAIFRMRSVQLLMERNREQVQLPRTNFKNDADNLFGYQIGKWVLWGILMLMAAMVVFGAIRMGR